MALYCAATYDAAISNPRVPVSRPSSKSFARNLMWAAMAWARMAAANMASRSLAVWALLAAIVLAINLGGYPLLDPDEGRNGEVGREMAATNDYVMPRLDTLPYLDKPIVYFAAEAAAMEIVGPTEAAARFPAWLFTIATAALLAWFAKRVGGGAPATARLFRALPRGTGCARAARFRGVFRSSANGERTTDNDGWSAISCSGSWFRSFFSRYHNRSGRSTSCRSWARSRCWQRGRCLIARRRSPWRSLAR